MVQVAGAVARKGMAASALSAAAAAAERFSAAETEVPIRAAPPASSAVATGVTQARSAPMATGDDARAVVAVAVATVPVHFPAEPTAAPVTMVGVEAERVPA